MKNFLTLVSVFLTLTAIAQPARKQERIKALRVAYISDKLQLTQDEAQKFWPIFNAFDAKQAEVRLQKKVLNLKLRPENRQSISDADMSKLLLESENIDKSLQENRKQFIKSLQGVLPVQKILILKQLEDEFKQQLMQQIKNRRKERP